MAQSGNGIDIGAVYELLTQLVARIDRIETRIDRIETRVDYMSARLDSHDRKFDQLLDVANDHRRALAAHDRRFDNIDADLSGLRADVGTYHATVVGHGIHYTELGERVDRIERHLDPAARGR